MPYIETVDDLVEYIADLAGAYGGGPLDGSDHPDDCACRICFTASMTIRMWRALENSSRLGQGPPEE